MTAQNSASATQSQTPGNQQKQLSIHENPSLIRRTLEKLLDWMEVGLAKSSLVGNPPVFDTAVFP